MSIAAPPDDFVAHLALVTQEIAGEPLNATLQERLNRDFPAGGAWFEKTRAFCVTGCAEGWLCAREAGGIRYGRAVRAEEATQGLSVDVVEMKDVAGPHHQHPKGEIDLVMPLEGDPAFDGVKAGWKVYEPGSAHRPTVSGGKALVLYLLPDGAIEFTR